MTGKSVWHRAVFAGMALLLVLVVTVYGAAFAQAGVPVVTTPTPRPTATPTVLTARQALALTPAAQRHGRFVFLPLAAQQSDGQLWDVSVGSFNYTAQPGDTLWSLALDFGRDLDTLSCVTSPTGPDAEKLTPGQTIIVPALDDLCYTVTPGDTLASIATRHGVPVATIVNVPWNGFTSPPYSVRPRQRILLPGARLSARVRPERHSVSYATDTWAATAYKDWPFGDGKFIWPVQGWISQDAHPGHLAIDIAVPIGTPVKAADRGVVVKAGWSPVGYGFRVIIDHKIDYVTLYGHLSDIYVQEGDVVGKGQVIGTSGSNGNITGPHLHFEIRDFGNLVDPLTLLPK